MKLAVKALLILAALAIVLVALWRLVWIWDSTRPKPVGMVSSGPQHLGPLANSEYAHALFDQAAAKTLRRQYAKYLPDELFGSGEIFGVDKKEDGYEAYVYLSLEEYVGFKNRLYLMSGASGEAILRFDVRDGAHLKEIIWSADGEGHDEWMAKHFPEPYLAKAKAYKPYYDDGRSRLEAVDLHSRFEKKENTPFSVERDNLLEIDRDTGKYKIIKTRETGEPGKDYKFETEIIEQGVLEPAAAEGEQ